MGASSRLAPGDHIMKAYARHARREGRPALKRFKLAPKYAHHRSDGTRKHAEAERRQTAGGKHVEG